MFVNFIEKETSHFNEINNTKTLYSLMNDKKDAQNTWAWDLVHEEPFGYRVAHQGYILTSCPGILL